MFAVPAQRLPGGRLGQLPLELIQTIIGFIPENRTTIMRLSRGWNQLMLDPMAGMWRNIDVDFSKGRLTADSLRGLHRIFQTNIISLRIKPTNSRYSRQIADILSEVESTSIRNLTIVLMDFFPMRHAAVAQLMGNDRVLSNFVCMHSQQLSLLTYVHIIAEDTFDVGLMLRLFTDCPNLEVLSCNRTMQEVNGLPSPPLPAAALARLVALQVPFLGVPFWQRVLPNLRALKVLTISCPQRYTGRVDKEGLIAPALVSVLGEAHIQQELRHLELSNGISENELVHLANLYANSQPGLRNCVVDSRIELDEPIRRIISSIVVSHVHTLQSLNCPVIVAEGIRSLLEGNHIFRSLTVMEVKGHAPFPIGRGNDDRRNFAPWVSTLLQRTPSLVHLALSFISGLDFATYAALIQLVQLRSVKLLLCDDFIPYFVQFIQVAAGNGVPALQDIDVQSVCIHLAIILCRFSVQAAISPVSEDFDFTKELDAGRKEEVLYCLRKPNVNSHSTPSPMELLIEFNICKWADCFLFLASSVF